MILCAQILISFHIKQLRGFHIEPFRDFNIKPLRGFHIKPFKDILTFVLMKIWIFLREDTLHTQIEAMPINIFFDTVNCFEDRLTLVL